MLFFRKKIDLGETRNFLYLNRFRRKNKVQKRFYYVSFYKNVKFDVKKVQFFLERIFNSSNYLINNPIKKETIKVAKDYLLNNSIEGAGKAVIAKVKTDILLNNTYGIFLVKKKLIPFSIDIEIKQHVGIVMLNKNYCEEKNWLDIAYTNYTSKNKSIFNSNLNIKRNVVSVSDKYDSFIIDGFFVFPYPKIFLINIVNNGGFIPVDNFRTKYGWIAEDYLIHVEKYLNGIIKERGELVQWGIDARGAEKYIVGVDKNNNKLFEVLVVKKQNNNTIFFKEQMIRSINNPTNNLLVPYSFIEHSSKIIKEFTNKINIID